MIPTASSVSNNARRNRPNGNGQSISRSNSFLGTIKNLVTAPLNWFAAHDGSNTEEAKGKRRRLPQSNSSEDVRRDGGSRNKKMRVSSPDRQAEPGYLDPPDSILKQAGPHLSPQTHSFNPSGNRYHPSSVFTPFDATQRQSPYRHSVSPFAAVPEIRPLSISRTMSLDPPYQYGHGRDSSLGLLSRDMSMDPSSLRNAMSVGRDVSMPPARSSFQMRTSLTPKPSSSNHALSQKSRERDPSEPPPVSSLMSNPIFVRAPLDAHHHRSMSAQPTVTLGSYVESQRRTLSPVRHHSALLFAQPSTSFHASDGNRPITAAEKALHELDVYKTPLLPTRLKTVSSVPDIFKPKKARNLILMHEKDDKSSFSEPRKKKSKKLQVNGTKPYAGEGGMKKLLARRKKEEEEEWVEAESHDEKANRKPNVKRHAKDRLSSPESAPIDKKELEPSDHSSFPERTPEMTAGRPQSSLRVGRTKAFRSHLARPARPVNRFSARYADEEGDDQMQDVSEKSKDQLILEEAAKKVPVFEIKPDFTFAKEATPVQHDLSDTKEPPIASLPFSFTKSSSAADVSVPSEQTAQPQPSEKPNVTIVSSSSSDGSSLSSIGVPPAPTIALVPPTPDPSTARVSDVKVTEPGSDFLFKSSVSEVTATQTNSSFSAPEPGKDAVNPFLDGGNFGKQSDKMDQSAPPSFSLFSPETRASTTGEKDKAAEPLHIFGASNMAKDNSGLVGSSPSVPLFGAPAMIQTDKALEPSKSTPISMFGGSANSSTAFSFSAPPGAVSVSAVPPMFTFGRPNVGTPKGSENSAQGSSKSTSAAPTPLFGESATVDSVPPKSVSGFDTVGSRATSSLTTRQPSDTVSASASFPFGQPSSNTDDKAKTPFSFGAAPSTPPAAAEKKPIFTFGLPAGSASTSTVSFGAPAGSSTGTDVSNRPFTFGVVGAPAVRSVTPPKNDDQDLHMEESPTREMQLNGNSKESRPSLFSFGNNADSATTTFGQSSQSSSAPFTFGSPATNSFPPKVDTNVAQTTPMTFGGFGQSQSSNTGFSFGPKIEPPKPTTASPFSFQTAPSTATGFTFTAPTANPNPFTQASSQSGSTPSSPSTFNQPTSTFTFNPPAGTPTAPFTFGGSQPSSPASVGHTNLASPATTTFTFGAGQATAPFGAPAAAPPPPPGGALFTIGAAPPPTPHPGRQVKRLPLRRGGKR